MDLFWVSYGHLIYYCSYGQKFWVISYQFWIMSLFESLSGQNFDKVSTWNLAHFMSSFTFNRPHTNWGHTFSFMAQFTYYFQHNITCTENLHFQLSFLLLPNYNYIHNTSNFIHQVSNWSITSSLLKSSIINTEP